MFFQSKATAIPKSIIPNTVHVQRVTRDTVGSSLAVVVCGISKPISKSQLDKFNSDITIDNNNVSGEDNVYIVGNSKTGEFYHLKKQASTSIVIYKVIDVRSYRLECTPVAKFIEMYEPVIGYSRDGVPITDSDIDLLTNTECCDCDDSCECKCKDEG